MKLFWKYYEILLRFFLTQHNHAFIDGNKRIGMYVMMTFLEVNGIHLECTDEEVAETGLAVASGEKSYEELLEWVEGHKV